MAREQQAPWKRWGPYLSERQWGTVREDYSQAGDVWDHFTHDQARSRAYRWGEDGIAGISDDQQLLCFALAFWNGADPILKERLFGLTNREGNHGEDCKEYYFYLDATPTYSYLKYLYKYPQPSFPYKDLVQTNRHRGRCEPEYELLDTGVFDEDRYFDIFVEYAKQEAEDLLIRISVWNRGPEPATLHLLPTLWFRNTWSWYPKTAKPVIGRTAPVNGRAGIEASHSALGDWSLFCDRAVPLLFTENETNLERGGWSQNASPYVKDGINNFVVHGQARAVNPFNLGTKAAAHYKLELAPGAVEVVRLRLVNRELLGGILDRGQGATDVLFGSQFEECLQVRRQEADEFYRDLAPPNLDDDSRNVMRQAMAGMLWSMQFYLYPVGDWVMDMALHYAKQGPRGTIRNEDWTQIEYADLISVPDKWEYPGLAAWNLAIQAVILARLDIDLAKQQLRLITQQSYAHPSGQLPGSEGNFSDVNPPVYATAAWQIYLLEKALRGTGDLQFLEGVFHRLLLNFTWWANRKDRMGRNVFEGGFIGLDNVGIFDRSVPLPTGGYLEQADGASWMAVYSLDMLTIALELALHNPVYQELAGKFYEHFIYIAAAMSRVGD
ncbi:MAG TPA: glucosidase, partial [Blastocatellia bacterium]|nr:glucosidase [Blastocatellia bacterium]